MTHHTDAARAEFEAWARGYGTWEVKRDDDVALGTTGYTDITLTVAWHAVQAARRAPAVQSMTLEQAAASMRATQAQPARIIAASGSCAPATPVPHGLLEAAQRAHDWMDSQADSQSKGNFHSFDLLCLRQERDALAEALAAAPQPPEAEDLGKKLQDAQRRSDFFKRRCDLLQIVQRCMRDPERTLVCDVLANGHLLHDVDSEAGKARYLAPEAAPVQLPEPVAKIFFDRKCCEVSELPAWENLRPYGTHELVSVQQVRQLLANHGIQEQST